MDENTPNVLLCDLSMYGIGRCSAMMDGQRNMVFALGGVSEKPVGRNGQLVLRPVATVTATFNGQAIDAAQGGTLMRKLKALLENPYLLL